MRKKWLKILLLGLFLLMLTACGGAQSFNSADDGLKITVDSSWSMLDKEEGLQKAYGSTEEDYQKMVDCVLEQSSGKALLSVEKYDVSVNLEQQKNYIQWLGRQYALLSEEEMSNWLKSQGAADTNLLEAYREAAINNDTSVATLGYIEILNEDDNWLAELSQITGFQLLAQEEVELLGQKTQILNYQYAASEDTMLEFMETSAIKDNMLYTVTIWGEQSKFAKKTDAYKEILTALEWVVSDEINNSEENTAE